jgi:hypothetical protein
MIATCLIGVGVECRDPATRRHVQQRAADLGLVATEVTRVLQSQSWPPAQIRWSLWAWGGSRGFSPAPLGSRLQPRWRSRRLAGLPMPLVIRVSLALSPLEGLCSQRLPFVLQLPWGLSASPSSAGSETHNNLSWPCFPIPRNPKVRCPLAFVSAWKGSSAGHRPMLFSQALPG